jgi:hypothetical protein
MINILISRGCKHAEAEIEKIFLILRLGNYGKSPDHIKSGGYITLNVNKRVVYFANLRVSTKYPE